MNNNIRIIKLHYFILICLLFICPVPMGCNGSVKEEDKVHSDNLIDEKASEAEAKMDKSKVAESKTDEYGATESELTKIEEKNINDEIDIEVLEMMDYMTIEEKVAQLFIVYPESLVAGVPCVTMAGEATKESIDNIPVGGVLYMSQNLKSPDQVKSMLNNIQSYSMDRINLPMFLSVDEEGGRIARIANNNGFGQNNVGDMWNIGSTGDDNKAYEAGVAIGSYLSELGFNLDFAPVADVSAYEYGSVIGNRSFSSDPGVVADMTAAFSKGIQSKGVVSVYKHFPGHGSTVGDPHNGYAYTDKNLKELIECDMIPFRSGIENNVSMIMVGHISLPQVLENGTPASLSKEIMTDILRDSMGYDGIIVTDAMNMGAITDNYDSDEAAVLAFNAGADVILMPKDFNKAYEGILNAVKDGNITEESVDESVKRILRLKIKLKKGKLN